MELRHLRYFVAVAETLHFGRAALRLHVSQPALSQQILDLEAEIGARLLERTPRGVQLTSAGRAFLEPARASLAAAALAAEEARATALGSAGQLLIGLAETHEAATRALAAIEQVRPRFPRLILETTGIPWLEQPRAVSAGSLDAGFSWSVGAEAPLAGSYPSGVQAHRLFEDPGNYALLSAGHALAVEPLLRLDQLRELPMGLFTRELLPGLHDHLMAALRNAQMVHVRDAEGVGTAAASVPLVIARRGWALVTRSIATQPPTGTVGREIVDLHLPAGLDFIHADKQASEGLVALREAVLSQWPR